MRSSTRFSKPVNMAIFHFIVAWWDLGGFFGSPSLEGDYSTGPKKLSRFKEIKKEVRQVV
jgi:hypothetical protein